MLVYLIRKLFECLERAEHSRRDCYLSKAVDIGELERRMRMFDMHS
jgi:hypothetical protein